MGESSAYFRGNRENVRNFNLEEFPHLDPSLANLTALTNRLDSLPDQRDC